jgi:hypothetical protein
MTATIEAVVACGFIVHLVACDSSAYSANTDRADATNTRDTATVDDAPTTDTNGIADASSAADTRSNEDAGRVCDSGWLEGRFATNLRTRASRREWGGPQLALTLNSVSTTIPNMQPGEESHYINVGNFGFNVPTGSRVTGIEAEITRRSTPGGGIRDLAVQLYAAAYSPANRADTNRVWTNEWVTLSYGAPDDLWGSTWTPQQVNDAAFSIAFAVVYPIQNMSLDSPSVDRIRARVSWTCQ